MGKHGLAALRHEWKAAQELEMRAHRLDQCVADAYEIEIGQGASRQLHTIEGQRLLGAELEPCPVPTGRAHEIEKRRLVIASERCDIEMHAADQLHERFEHVAGLIPAIDVVAQKNDLQTPAIAPLLEILDDLFQHRAQEIISPMQVANGINPVLRVYRRPGLSPLKHRLSNTKHHDL